MAWTQADIDALKALMATGASSISYGGPPARTMTARPLAEMQALLAQMEQAVNGDGSTKPHYRLVTTKKGL